MIFGVADINLGVASIAFVARGTAPVVVYVNTALGTAYLTAINRNVSVIEHLNGSRAPFLIARGGIEYLGIAYSAGNTIAFAAALVAEANLESLGKGIGSPCSGLAVNGAIIDVEAAGIEREGIAGKDADVNMICYKFGAISCFSGDLYNRTICSSAALVKRGELLHSVL